MPRAPESPLEPSSVLGKNLLLLIGDSSVNAWAQQHKLSQTTINRILRDKQDATVSMIEQIAEAVKMKPHELLMPALGAADARAWPFERISTDEWQELAEKDRGYVEGEMHALIKQILKQYQLDAMADAAEREQLDDPPEEPPPPPTPARRTKKAS